MTTTHGQSGRPQLLVLPTMRINGPRAPHTCPALSLFLLLFQGAQVLPILVTSAMALFTACSASTTILPDSGPAQDTRQYTASFSLLSGAIARLGWARPPPPHQTSLHTSNAAGRRDDPLSKAAQQPSARRAHKLCPDARATGGASCPHLGSSWAWLRPPPQPANDLGSLQDNVVRCSWVMVAGLN
jgi:hypothetical protein